MRFGLDDGAPKSADEVAAILCKTVGQVSNTEIEVLRKLRA